MKTVIRFDTIYAIYLTLTRLETKQLTPRSLEVGNHGADWTLDEAILDEIKTDLEWLVEDIDVAEGVDLGCEVTAINADEHYRNFIAKVINPLAGLHSENHDYNYFNQNFLDDFDLLLESGYTTSRDIWTEINAYSDKNLVLDRLPNFGELSNFYLTILNKFTEDEVVHELKARIKQQCKSGEFALSQIVKTLAEVGVMKKDDHQLQTARKVIESLNRSFRILGEVGLGLYNSNGDFIDLMPAWESEED